ncbi:RING-H2 finger protein ATL8-like [Phragmites australis]|uniref:RING-H2 finger protein ATL8-like n=1 Tax=Phragmites australis TaxID=29695 RepID=UPI002D7883ED|nr:RING-H2 finger protein ATL8-like [Phragmites australis]
MPSRPPSSSSSSSSFSSSPGAAAHAPGGAMPADARNATAGAAGCLPADQSCFALSVSAGAPYSSRRDATAAAAAARACCTTTSYIVVLGISFGSLLAILLVLCAIRWYLVRRSASREASEAAAAADAGSDKKRSGGLDADAIAALPELVYRKEEEDEGDERECAVCLGAMAEGDAARRLPRCMHVFHRGCVDVWLREHSTCPVCRAEVVVRPVGEGCAEKEREVSASRASTSTARPQERRVDDGERDLEAQQ